MNFWKEVWKLQINETSFGSAVQASKSQHEGDFLIIVHSLKEENKTSPGCRDKPEYENTSCIAYTSWIENLWK